MFKVLSLSAALLAVSVVSTEAVEADIDIVVEKEEDNFDEVKTDNFGEAPKAAKIEEKEVKAEEKEVKAEETKRVKKEKNGRTF